MKDYNFVSDIKKARKIIQRYSQNNNTQDSKILAKIRRLSNDIVKWTEQTRVLANTGKTFSFEGREYLKPIYRDPHKLIQIVKGRQTEITEFSVNWLLFHLTKHAGTTGLYITDRDDHISIYSKIRMRDWAIRKSDILSYYADPDSGNVSWLPFKNTSNLFMYSGYNDFVKARSVPADFAVIDEIQNQNAKAIDVVRESMRHSKFRKMLIIGTGDDEGSPWNEQWNNGDQKIWDAESKSWIPQKPELSHLGSCYHIDQAMVPFIDAAELEAERAEMPARYRVTESIGWWHKGARRPLTPNDIKALFDTNITLQSPEEVDPNLGPLFVGIDWGGGKRAYTIIWIWQLVDYNAPIFRLVYLKKITESSPEKQAQMAINVIDSYQEFLKMGIMDAGGGPHQVERIENRYGPFIPKNIYMQRPEDPLETKDLRSSNKLKTDRTWVIESIIQLITEPIISGNHTIPKLQIPFAEPKKVEWIIDHFTAIEAESTELASGKRYTRYTHDEANPDDALHACGYAWLAWKISGSKKRPAVATGKMGSR